MWKEAIVAYFNVIYLKLPGGVERYQKIVSQDNFGRFKPTPPE
jgi:hypothetical protein